ncbi:MAG: YezD family protein [Gammaproteobacteria bacterium]
MSKTVLPQPLSAPDHERVLKYIANAMQSIRYGSVELVIHDGQVVQVETRQKRRFDSQARGK